LAYILQKQQRGRGGLPNQGGIEDGTFDTWIFGTPPTPYSGKTASVIEEFDCSVSVEASVSEVRGE
jgi:hypothetical protein